jgi:hypothetical protein
MYVLLYVAEDNKPSYIQGTLEKINEALRRLWMKGVIDREDWDYYRNWQLLGIEDGVLTPIANVDCLSVPYFEV